jgi:hypothetical protein
MDEAQAIRIANRAHAKKRWSKAGRKERTRVKDARAAAVRARLMNRDGRDRAIERIRIVY